MIDADFVHAIVENSIEPKVVEIHGSPRLLAPGHYKDLTPPRPKIDTLKVGTLTGFVEYLETNVDQLALDALLVHVKDPGTVVLRHRIAGEADEFRRHVFLVATIELVGAPFPFGTYLDAETFTVALQTQFVRSPVVDELLALIASIRESTVRETVDDGVAQEVKTGRGVTLVGSQKLPNPIELAPFRTFREIPQPASRFVLRAREGGQAGKPALALFEADGGAWKLAALKALRDYLSPRVKTAVLA